MNRVNWDTLPESVRQTIRSMVTAPDGSILEQNGEPYVRVLPYPKSNEAVCAEEWTSENNRRRCELIDREIDGQLTPDERVELERLQEQLRNYTNKVAPLPLGSLRKLHQELLTKAAKANGSEVS